MNVTPTFSTTVLVGLSVLTVGLAVVGSEPMVLGWAGAIVVGLAATRMLTRTTIARARAAGFEMLWQQAERTAVAHRLQPFTLTAELRNRSGEILVLEHIAPLAPAELEVRIQPSRAVMPPHSSLTLKVQVTPLRVGFHGLQGMTVVVRDDGAAFEAQLTFANCIVIETRPQILAWSRLGHPGGRGRNLAAATKTRPIAGESVELRELRELQRGDALRKIAWKASARRGRLLVRDDEQEQHSVLYFVLDASVELWAGVVGKSALDEQIDGLASVMKTSLRRGNRVGLAIVGSRTLALVEPGQGRAQEGKLLAALIQAATTRDSDRSLYDEQDIGAMILEQLRPIDPKATKQFSPLDLDAIARLAHRHLSHAPLAPPPEPQAPTIRERTLRQYLAAFGLPSPARTTTDRDATDRELLATVRTLLTSRPDRIVFYSPYPSARLIEGLVSLKRRLQKARIELGWTPTDTMLGLPAPRGSAGAIIVQAMAWHRQADRDKGELALAKIGIRMIQRAPVPSLSATSTS